MPTLPRAPCLLLLAAPRAAAPPLPRPSVSSDISPIDPGTYRDRALDRATPPAGSRGLYHGPDRATADLDRAARRPRRPAAPTDVEIAGRALCSATSRVSSPGLVLGLALLAACARSPGPPARAPEPPPVSSDIRPAAASEAPASPPRSEAELQAALADDLHDVRAYEELARLYYARSVSQPSYRLILHRLLAQAFAVLAAEGRDSAELRFVRALLARDRGDLDAMRSDLDAALELDPRAPAVLRERAVLALDVRDFARASAVLRDLSQTPSGAKDPGVWLTLGVAEAAQRRHAEARAAYEQAVRLAPRDPRPHYDLALLAIRRSMEDDVDMIAAEKLEGRARSDLQRFLELADEPRYARQRRRAAELLASIERWSGCASPSRDLSPPAWSEAEEAAERARLLELERQVEAEEVAERARLLGLERRIAAEEAAEQQRALERERQQQAADAHPGASR